MKGVCWRKLQKKTCFKGMRTKHAHGISNRFDDFHAGNFLRGIMQEEGHDLAWLAASLHMPTEILSCILTQPNMDAELFVRIGKPMEPLFMQRVHESIFGKKATA